MLFGAAGAARRKAASAMMKVIPFFFARPFTAPRPSGFQEGPRCKRFAE
jgi:hypothetical protein